MLGLRLLSHAADTREGGYWRQRAQMAERDLALERGKTESIARQLQELAARFDAMAARLEAISSSVTVAPETQATATPTSGPSSDGG